MAIENDITVLVIIFEALKSLSSIGSTLSFHLDHPSFVSSFVLSTQSLIRRIIQLNH